jgi:hypothetical protein
MDPCETAGLEVRVGFCVSGATGSWKGGSDAILWKLRS